MRYRKRPVTVEAVQWDGDNMGDIRNWTDRRFRAALMTADRPGVTAEVWNDLQSTWVGVKTGDWIIRGVRGEYYPHDDQVFRQVYGPVDFY